MSWNQISFQQKSRYSQPQQLERNIEEEEEASQQHLVMLSTRSKLGSFKKEAANRQIEEYRKVSSSLNNLQSLKRENRNRMLVLKRNISGLQFMNKKSVNQTHKTQLKTNKIQDSQKFALYLQSLKRFRHQNEENSLEHKKQLCSSTRQSLQKTKQLSQSIFCDQKEERIKQIKESQKKLREEYQNNLQEFRQESRKRANSIRESQLNLREKFRKYEQYKYRVAKLNYTEKLQKEYLRHLSNRKKLESLKKRQNEEGQLFAKTETLKKQSKKIESMYLTGVE